MSPAAHDSSSRPVLDRPVRVVVADDQELFRRGLRLLLAQEADIEVVGEADDADSADSAANLAEQAEPDVLLIDVRMRCRGGIRACERIKQIAPHIQIIMLTMSEEDRDLYKAIRAGASGYLLKDSSTDEVAAPYAP